jgi:hypothetical protein
MLNAQLKKAYIAIKGDFLLPEEYTLGHKHLWVALDAGYCVCQLCGLDHVCFQGKCPEVRMLHSERICSISGCVILMTEMKPEWGAMDRVTMMNMEEGNEDGPPSSRGQRRKFPRHHFKKSRCPSSLSKKSDPRREVVLWNPKKVIKGNMEVYDFVEMVVREILDSPKTLKCREEEMQRDRSRKMASLAKVLREMVNNHHDDYPSTHEGLDNKAKSMAEKVPPFFVSSQCGVTMLSLCPRPNLLLVEARLSWMCRSSRDLFFCTASATNLRHATGNADTTTPPTRGPNQGRNTSRPWSGSLASAWRISPS